MSLAASSNAASAQFKVVLLGEGRVGKTCLCLRYVQNTFNDGQETTIQATYLDKRLNIGKTPVKLMIWDTAGQEIFHALGPIYYREANGALLVYDISDRDSFAKVTNWVKELRKVVGRDIVLVIVANKCDLENQRQVTEADAKSYSDSVGAIHMAASAKTGKNVDAVFLELTKQMLQFRQQQQQASASSGGGGGDDRTHRKTVPITNVDKPTNTSCCS